MRRRAEGRGHSAGARLDAPVRPVRCPTPPRPRLPPTPPHPPTHLFKLGRQRINGAWLALAAAQLKHRLFLLGCCSSCAAAATVAVWGPHGCRHARRHELGPRTPCFRACGRCQVRGRAPTAGAGRGAPCRRQQTRGRRPGGRRRGRRRARGALAPRRRTLSQSLHTPLLPPRRRAAAEQEREEARGGQVQRNGHGSAVFVPLNQNRYARFLSPRCRAATHRRNEKGRLPGRGDGRGSRAAGRRRPHHTACRPADAHRPASVHHPSCTHACPAQVPFCAPPPDPSASAGSTRIHAQPTGKLSGGFKGRHTEKTACGADPHAAPLEAEPANADAPAMAATWKGVFLALTEKEKPLIVAGHGG